MKEKKTKLSLKKSEPNDDKSQTIPGKTLTVKNCKEVGQKLAPSTSKEKKRNRF